MVTRSKLDSLNPDELDIEVVNYTDSHDELDDSSNLSTFLIDLLAGEAPDAFQSYSNLRLESGGYIYIDTPRGWRVVNTTNPVSRTQMEDFLNSLEPPLLKEAQEAWKAKRAFVFCRDLSSSRLRISAYQTMGGRNLAFSIRRHPLQPVAWDRLGIATNYLNYALQQSTGLIIVTGATGSGKTTTITSLLSTIAAKTRVHIKTVEDPIEYILPPGQSVISQTEVGSDVDSFHEGIKEALLQYPNILMIGEIRDAETATAALSASESGHLVIATVHGSNALAAVKRLIDFFPPSDYVQKARVVNSVLRTVIYQKLVPNAERTRWVLAHEILTERAPVLKTFLDQITKDPTTDPNRWLIEIASRGDAHYTQQLKGDNDGLGAFLLNDSLVRLVTSKSSEQKIDPQSALKASYMVNDLQRRLQQSMTASR